MFEYTKEQEEFLATEITQEERDHYDEVFKKPLTEEEKQFIISTGWAFASEDYIYLPDDYDGCMAYGISSIRYWLISRQHKEMRIRCKGNKRLILKELRENDRS